METWTLRPRLDMETSLETLDKAPHNDMSADLIVLCR